MKKLWLVTIIPHLIIEVDSSTSDLRPRNKRYVSKDGKLGKQHIGTSLNCLKLLFVNKIDCL